jgi:hypothetical protein
MKESHSSTKVIRQQDNEPFFLAWQGQKNVSG